ncbi:neurotrophin 1 [Cimex lectularius]|uniref:Spaetzle n=1 Tax=Cimex lectularius TaxID=79782 RepID=A0A8I6S5D8_CIMLE|nr:neurotrophin 1 [Cimex lectularius]
MKIAWLFVSLALLIVSIKGTDDLDDVSFDDDENENIDVGNVQVTKSEPKFRYPQNEEEKRELIKKAMTAAFKRPGAWTHLGQVLPIVRIMSPPQRLALASLVMAQVMAGPGEPLPPVSKSENITSQLMLPIAVDIATMFRGLGRETQPEGGRSTSYAGGIIQGNRVSTATGPNIRRPPPTLNGMNRRNVNVHIDKVNLPRKRPPRPGMRKPASNTITITPFNCTLLKNNLCLETKDYPEEAILKSIKNERNPDAFKALLKEPTPENISYHDPHVIARRQGTPADLGKTMCSTTLEFARPKKARATSGQWKYIVNTGDYTQTLRLELCLKPLSPCSFLADEVESQCVQVYNYHRLLTWDESAGLTMDVFKVPTCCSCRILGYGGNIFHSSTTEQPITPVESPDINLVANDEPPTTIRKPLTPHTPSNPPLKGIRIRPYSPHKRRPGSVQHRGPPLPLEGESSTKEDIRYPPYENTLRRITRNNTVDRGKFKPHILPPPTPNQRHPALPIDSMHSDSMTISNFSPPPTTTIPSKRVNYSYHPIIDYFRPQVQEAERRVGLDWTPIDRPRSMTA